MYNITKSVFRIKIILTAYILLNIYFTVFYWYIIYINNVLTIKYIILYVNNEENENYHYKFVST